MTSASTVSRVEPGSFAWASETGPAAVVRSVLASAASADGVDALDEAALLRLRHHGVKGSEMWLAGSDGFAWLRDGALDLVVAPTSRGLGVGSALAAEAVPPTGGLTAWSHGNHPAAAALAPRYGLRRVRDLWLMRRSLDDLPALPQSSESSVDVRAFRVGVDEDAFLAVNAAAFAHHPEQGGMTRADLDARIAEPWFDPAGFFLAWRGDELLGYHWTKVHSEPAGDFGEVYVVGIAPTAQGGGLGRLLTLTGLHHLASRGLAEVILYVESDNAPAVAVYERLGFTHAAADTHVMYARDAG
jgi:mycothiol synthase